MLGWVSASRNCGPVSNRSSIAEPVWSPAVAAYRCAAESSTDGLTYAPPLSGRRPRTDLPATRAVNDARESEGSTRQVPAVRAGVPTAARSTLGVGGGFGGCALSWASHY